MAIQLRCFPMDDHAFRKTVGKCLRGLALVDEEQLATDAIRALDHLREFYPLLRVRVADSLALTNGDAIVYVFRDGHALPTVNEGPGAMRMPSRLAVAIRSAAALTSSSEVIRARSTRITDAAFIAHGRRQATLDRFGRHAAAA